MTALVTHGLAAALVFLSACNHPSERARRGESGAPVIPIPATLTATTNAPPRLQRIFERNCQERAQSSCDVREEACQARLFELVQCLSARQGVRPPLRFLSAEASRQKRAEHHAHASGEGTALQQAIHSLGLGKAGEPGAHVEGTGVGANAYYVPRERLVYFVAGEPSDYAGEHAGLIVAHEYVHAIQDRHGELLAAQEGRGSRSFDQELALWSRFEGEATLYEEVVRALRHDRTAGWVVERFASQADRSDSAIVRQRRPLEAAFATFPYTYGAYWAALESAQPASTHQLLSKRHAWPVSTTERCEDESPASLAPGHPRRARDTLGAWLIQAYVQRHTDDPARARSAARSWRGDVMSVYSRAAGSATSFVWRTCWDSNQTARDMRTLIAAQLHASAGDRAHVRQEAHRVTANVLAEELAQL